VSISQAFLLLISMALGTAAGPPTELRLPEIFGLVGTRGLEFSAKARGLEGRRVRVAGYMVRRDESAAGAFLLAPVPVQIDDEEYGLADDLPAATILVEVPALAGKPIPYTSRRLALTGVLRLGPRQEPDGRTSFVRLVLDELPSDFTLP